MQNISGFLSFYCRPIHKYTKRKIIMNEKSEKEWGKRRDTDEKRSYKQSCLCFNKSQILVRMKMVISWFSGYDLITITVMFRLLFGDVSLWNYIFWPLYVMPCVFVCMHPHNAHIMTILTIFYLYLCPWQCALHRFSAYMEKFNSTFVNQ